MRTIGRLCAVAALAVAFGACGQEKIEQAELEEEVKSVVAQEVGQQPKAIECPGDLEAKKGEKMTCTLVAPDDSKVDVVVTVTSAEDGDAKFSVEVGTEVRR